MDSEIPVPTETNSLTMARDTAIRPVTIRQALSAEMPRIDADFKIDGHLVRTIGIVANVVQVIHLPVAEHIRRDRYVLDDGTSRGRITASHTVAVEVPMLEPPPDYVHVAGTLFNYRGTNFIRVTRIRVVKDPHQIYFHLLEAMMVTTAFRKGAYPVTSRRTEQPAIASQNVDESKEENVALPINQPIGGASSPLVDHSDRDNDSEDEVSSNASHSTYRTATSGSEDVDELRIVSSLSALDIDVTVHRTITGAIEHPVIGRDPYSHLSPLQRDILLQLFNAADQPGAERLHVTMIRDGIRPGLRSSAEEIEESLDELLREQYLATDKDFLHYWLKPLGWKYTML